MPGAYAHITLPSTSGAARGYWDPEYWWELRDLSPFSKCR